MTNTIEIVEQSHELLFMTDPSLIEVAGRTCYKSEDKITDTSAEPFIKGLIKRKHDAMLEHGMATVRFITNRGVTHELVRHRMSSFAQESTRYVNYGGKPMQFIKPVWLPLLVCQEYHMQDVPRQATYDCAVFVEKCLLDAKYYNEFINVCEWKPEQARESLPNALKTEIVMTGNWRQWRHVMALRGIGTTGRPHPQMKALMEPLLDEFIAKVPVLFEDLKEI